MSEQNFPDNTLYVMDNLEALRGLNSGTVDLIASDPPFNTGTERAGRDGSYHDDWRWEKDPRAAGQPVLLEWLEEIRELRPALAAVIETTRLTGGENSAAHLCFLGIRLLEMRRVLRPHGSIYLQCDHRSSAGIRMAMDAVMGVGNFRSEIVWQRTNSHNGNVRYGNVTDSILYYAGGEATWNAQHHERSEEELGGCRVDALGRSYRTSDLTAPNQARTFRWRGVKPTKNRSWAYSKERLEELWEAGRIMTDREGRPRLRGLIQYLDEMPPGPPLQNLWTDIPRLGNTASERTGAPDQKPVPLYERIIQASSNPGDLVLDPFVGSGTTLIAAHQLGRRWLGMELRENAAQLACRRLLEAGIDVDERSAPRQSLVPELRARCEVRRDADVRTDQEATENSTKPSQAKTPARRG